MNTKLFTPPETHQRPGILLHRSCDLGEERPEEFTDLAKEVALLDLTQDVAHQLRFGSSTVEFGVEHKFPSLEEAGELVIHVRRLERDGKVYYRARFWEV